MKVEYILTKKTWVSEKCPKCSGDGKTSFSFRSRTYISNCKTCKGLGSIQKPIIEEISLSEALNNISKT